MDTNAFEVNEPKFQVLQVTHQTKVEEILNFIKQRLLNGKETILTVQPDYIPENCAKIVEDLQREGIDPFLSYLVGMYAKKINSEDMDITEILTKIKTDYIDPITAEVYGGFGDQISVRKVFEPIPGDKNESILISFQTAYRHYKDNNIYTANEFRILALLIGVYVLISKYPQYRNLISLKVHGVTTENFNLIDENESKILEKINLTVLKASRIYKPKVQKGLLVKYLELEKQKYPGSSIVITKNPGKDYIEEIGFLENEQNQRDFAQSQILAARNFTIKAKNLDQESVNQEALEYAQKSQRDVVVLNYFYSNYSLDLSLPVDPVNVLFALGRNIANIPDFEKLSDQEVYDLIKYQDPQLWKKEMIKYLFVNLFMGRYYISKNDLTENTQNTQAAKILKILEERPEIYQSIIEKSKSRNILLVMNEEWKFISKEIEL